MNGFLRAASALALCCSIGACATITRGTTTNFKVASTPPGALVKTSTGFSCSPTPCIIAKMPRKEHFDATVSLAGYQTKTVHVDSVVAGGGAAGFAGNVVAGGVIGMVVDGTDGSMNDLSPNPLVVVLDPAPTAAAGTPPGALSDASSPPKSQ